MKNYFIASLFIVFLSSHVFAQKTNPFNQFLPIMDLPFIDWSSPMNEDEPIIFNGSASIYYQFINSYYQGNKKTKQALYANFRTHIRMYQSQSLPVRTPSYKFILGYQRSFTFGVNNLHLALETGHYSNGQSFCAWDPSVKDGSEACRSIYNAITDDDNLAEMFNRNSGNFSTNLTKITASYIIPPMSKGLIERRTIAHRFGASFQVNHVDIVYLFNVDEKEGDVRIVGDQVYTVMMESFLAPISNADISIINEIEYIKNAHPSINPWRYRLTLNIFPYDLYTAFFIAFTSGHDNYNYRIVDSRNQISLGIRWDLMDRKELKNINHEFE